MRKLARKFKKSSSDDDVKLSLPTSDDSRPIDTQEQEEIVRSFEKVEARQSRIWRVVFAGLICCFVVFLLYSIFEQASNPWELRYHAYFMKEIDPKTVILADWFAIFSCLLAIVGLVHSSNHHKRWIWFSCCSGTLLAVFWLNYMLRMPKFRWDVIWLPFGPLSASVICLYVDHLLKRSAEEVKKLRGYMYSYKSS
ncbi:hypothetical protein V2J09_002373 [Rumex salicifolius]